MKRPAVFFDRDNTLIACDGYLGDPAKVVLVEGAAEAVARVRGMGFAPVVFSNQSGVARGMFPEEAVHAVNARLDELLHEENPQAIIDRHDFCPYHPTASIDRYRVDSDLRKPKPGMIYLAAAVLGLDLSRSWVVGDAPRDIAAGHAAGLRTVLLKIASLPPSPATQEGAEASPDFVASSLREAMDFIERNRAPEPAEAKPAMAAAPAVLANGNGMHAGAEQTNGDTMAAASEPETATAAVANRGRYDAWTSSPSSASSASASSASATAAPSPTSTKPVRTEDPVKLTPRPNFKPESAKPAVKAEPSKPAQGGIVVKPSQAPSNLTWGERMRLAKQGGAVSPANTARAAAPSLTAAVISAPPGSAVADSQAPEPTPEPEADETSTEPVTNTAAEAKAEEAPETTEETATTETVADTHDATPEPEPDEARPASRGFSVFSKTRSQEPAVDVMEPTAASHAPVTLVAQHASQGNPVIADTSRVEELLEEVLIELRRREEQASLDFSVSKLLAGITQVLALAALFFAYLNRGGIDLLPTLLVALTLQTLTISLLIMGKQR